MTPHESDLAVTEPTPEERMRALRERYPLKVYEETYWEIYDEIEARVVALFYNEEDALTYIEWRNVKDQEQ